MLRVRRLFMLAGLCAAASLLAVRGVRAEFERSLLARSESLFELARHWVRTEPRTLVLNGAHIILTTGSSEQPLSALLDHFQDACRRRSGGVHAAARTVYGGRQPLPSLIDGVLRAEQAGQGMVACFDFGEEALGPQEWLTRLERFARSADLAELGQLKVVRAEAHGDGSFFVTAWNDGPVPLARMFPRRGDAPGLDFPDLPRPAQARRILSAWQEQAGTALNVYAALAPADVAFEAHTRQLEAHGWHLADESAAHSKAGTYGALMVQGGRSVVVQTQADGPHSLVTLLPMNAGPGAVRIH